MSLERTSGILFAVLLLFAVQHVLSLECYVCSSLENPSCSSDLENIEKEICGTWTTSSTVSTVITTTFTDSSGSTASSTQAEDSSSSQSSTSAFESSTDISTQSTSGSIESEVTADTSDSSKTSSATITESANSFGTEQSPTEDTGSTSSITDTSDTSAYTESDSSSTTEPNSFTTEEPTNSNTSIGPLPISDDHLLYNLVGRNMSSMIVPKNSEDYVCYKIVYTKNSTSVTERGCYSGTSWTTCDALKEDISPDTSNECIACEEDSCNSTSTIQLRATTLLLLLMTVFVLSR